MDGESGDSCHETDTDNSERQVSARVTDIAAATEGQAASLSKHCSPLHQRSNSRSILNSGTLFLSEAGLGRTRRTRVHVALRAAVSLRRVPDEPHCGYEHKSAHRPLPAAPSNSTGEWVESGAGVKRERASRNVGDADSLG